MAKKSSATKPGGPNEDGSEPKKTGRRKFLSLAAAGLLLAGGGAWFAVGRSSAAKHATADGRPAVAFVDVKEMTVNLASEPNQERPRFLRFKVALEVRDPRIVTEVQPLLPRVEDIFQVFVRELRASDLEGSGGIHRLREELLRRVNVAVAPSRVDAVLFKEVIVQ